MTIGPEPTMQIDSMSVRLGIVCDAAFSARGFPARASEMTNPAARTEDHALRTRFRMTPVGGARFGGCDARTQGAPIAAAIGATEDAAARRRARSDDTAFILNRVLRHYAALSSSTHVAMIGAPSCGPGLASGWNCAERARSAG